MLVDLTATALLEVLNKDEWFALSRGDALFKADRLLRRMRAKGLKISGPVKG